MTLPADREGCLRALLGAYVGDRVAGLDDAGLLLLAEDDAHPLAEDVGRTNRQRLGAAVRLALILRGAAWAAADRVLGDDDVVARFSPRCPRRDERAVWLLCLDEAGGVEAEVLVQMGGDPAAPPPARVLLRHALFKGARSVYVADCRPRWDPSADQATRDVLGALVAAGELAGVAVRGWLLLARDGSAFVPMPHSGASPAILSAA